MHYVMELHMDVKDIQKKIVDDLLKQVVDSS